jgi:glycosyltransferase involved in cell wall biosynthesis
MTRSRPHILFVGSLYAGHRTRFLNLRRHTERDHRISASYRHVSGWRDGGIVERFTFLPPPLRGRIRALGEASALARLPRPDAIWTSVWEVAVPYLGLMRGPLRTPVVLDLDRTYDQLESMAFDYFGREPRHGLTLAASLAWERMLWRSVTCFVPWSNWAATGLRRRGVDPTRIHVLPPGVDLEAWKTKTKWTAADQPLRLLFVGGDFMRKGGDILLEVFRSRFSNVCELDIVTHAAGSARGSARVRFHAAGPNSPELRQLFAEADLFVLPTKADCFGLAAVEAMASGLPVIMGNVGGAPDIVRHGETGWLIEPVATALAEALEAAVAQRHLLPLMGRRARADAEERFDGRRNDSRLVDVILDEVRLFRERHGAVQL